jgi:hypothetical protein
MWLKLQRTELNLSDEKLKLITKLHVENTVSSDLFKNYIIKIFENQINCKMSLK